MGLSRSLVRKPTYICNFHYGGFKGPSQTDSFVVPTSFKRHHDFYYQPAKRPHRLLQCSQDNTDDSQSSRQTPQAKITAKQLEAKCLVCQNEIEGVKKHVEDLKAELALLKIRLQHLDVMILKIEELVMYTGLNHVFESSKQKDLWLTTLPGVFSL